MQLITVVFSVDLYLRPNKHCGGRSIENGNYFSISFPMGIGAMLSKSTHGSAVPAKANQVEKMDGRGANFTLQFSS